MLRPESEQEQAFRAEVREWLEANLAHDLRNLTFRPRPEQARVWYRALFERGWIAPHWPASAGGMGATPVQQVVLQEELVRIGAPDLPTQGLNHIGPVLVKCGNAEQQARHLPKILNGDVIWCQGYSEPNAGSDLASLRTRAARDGDDLVINGHKIWTTWGHHADWMFALVRTSTGQKTRDGITFVLIDLKTPGITRRPIITIAGDDEFCEVFFDNVRVPVSNVVGEIDRGWDVATSLLAEERVRIGSPLHALRALARLRAVAAASPPSRRAQDLLEQAELEVEVLTAAYLDGLEALEDGSVGATVNSAYLKILATETTLHILDGAQELAGPLAAVREVWRDGDLAIDFSEMYLQSRRLPIYAGSNEVQRTILAQHVLGLKGGA